MLVTFSTPESFQALYLLCSSTFPEVAPVAPRPVREVMAVSQVSLQVVGYKPVGQSLASVGLLDTADTELCFLVT